MPEYHHEEKVDFGEEYYDEDLHDSDAEELSDAFAEAARLGRRNTKFELAKRDAYMNRGLRPFGQTDQQVDSPFQSSHGLSEDQDVAFKGAPKKLEDSENGMFDENQDDEPN